jgi:hypothetical protein
MSAKAGSCSATSTIEGTIDDHFALSSRSTMFVKLLGGHLRANRCQAGFAHRRSSASTRRLNHHFLAAALSFHRHGVGVAVRDLGDGTGGSSGKAFEEPRHRAAAATAGMGKTKVSSAAPQFTKMAIGPCCPAAGPSIVLVTSRCRDPSSYTSITTSSVELALRSPCRWPGWGCCRIAWCN